MTTLTPIKRPLGGGMVFTQDGKLLAADGIPGQPLLDTGQGRGIGVPRQANWHPTTFPPRTRRYIPVPQGPAYAITLLLQADDECYVYVRRYDGDENNLTYVGEMHTNAPTISLAVDFRYAHTAQQDQLFFVARSTFPEWQAFACNVVSQETGTSLVSTATYSAWFVYDTNTVYDEEDFTNWVKGQIAGAAWKPPPPPIMSTWWGPAPYIWGPDGREVGTMIGDWNIFRLDAARLAATETE